MSTSNCPESDSWKTEEPQRRPSINLLDMNQVLSVQPNSQQPEQQLKKLLYNSLQKFDPLQSREPPKPDPELKLTPTRLPRRPALSSHVSAERLITVDPDITPPSSPSRRVRQTSIARLAKPSTSLGKANRELAEFDPLISPVKEKRLSSSANKDHSKKGVQVKQIYIYNFPLSVFSKLLTQPFFFIFFFLKKDGSIYKITRKDLY